MIFQEQQCPVCGRQSTDAFLPCDLCRTLIEQKPAGVCSKCGTDLAGAAEICTECRNSILGSLESVSAVGDWRGPLREWLSMFKYGGDARLGGYLADLLYEIHTRTWPTLPIVPVPPRKQRLKKEGTDPVGILANLLEKRGCRVEHLLKRIGSQKQKSLNRRERLDSKALNYMVLPGITGLSGDCVLLDDVRTTGATLEVCASVLMEAGRGKVYGLVVCRD